MRDREAKTGALGVLNATARSRRADVETRKIVDAVSRQMGIEPDPLGAAEDGLCNIISGHGYERGLHDLQRLEERLIFHGVEPPNEEMMERIYFLHVLIDCFKDLVEAEQDRERKVPAARKN